MQYDYTMMPLHHQLITCKLVERARLSEWGETQSSQAAYVYISIIMRHEGARFSSLSSVVYSLLSSESGRPRIIRLDGHSVGLPVGLEAAGRQSVD